MLEDPEIPLMVEDQATHREDRARSDLGLSRPLRALASEETRSFFLLPLVVNN